MSKIKQVFGLTAMGLALLAGSQQAAAEVLLSENFDYAAGGLYGQGGWVRHSKNENLPIQLVSQPPTYQGYQDAAAGLAARIVGNDASEVTAHERLQKQFSDEGVMSGVIYMSALINVSKADVGNVYFLTMCQRGAKADNGIIDGKSGSEYVRVFAGAGSAEGKFKLGLSKNGASPQVQSEELDLNTTYLLVVKYEFVDGTANDKLTAYINPASGAEPATADLTADATKADVSATMGLQAVTLRQGSTSSTKEGPDVIVDAIRVADTWADLWGGTSEPDPGPDPVGDATITASESTLNFGSFYQYMKGTASINIKAEGLTENISVAISGSAVTASATSIPMDEAMSSDGYTLTLTYTAGDAALNETMTLSTAGADDVTVALTATSAPATAFANFQQLVRFNPFDVVYFQGRATVTYIDTPNKKIYCQDLYGGGAAISYEYCNEAPALTVGDRFNNCYLMIGETSMGVPTVYLLELGYNLIGSGYTVTPADLTLAELARDPETYLNRLVTVSDIDFGSAAGTEFATSGVAVTSGDASGRVRPFAGTDVIGTTVPAKATAVTGISTSASAAILTVRSLADIEAEDTPAGDPALTVETAMLVSGNEYLPVNVATPFARLTVKATDLPQAVPVYVSGRNGAMFSIDKDEIPAGTSTTEITITYTPTTIGQHTGAVVFDANPYELFQSYSFNARAYDPDNLPSVTVNAEGLKEFTTQPGTPVTQTITYTTAGLLDYGTVKVQGGDGAFRISSTSMLKDSKNMPLTITFAPTREGTFSADILFEADKAEPVTVQVSGVCSGQAPPEEKQGDDFTMESFSTANPQALVIEDFQNCGESNKPLHIDGWTNAALTGTRAWWAYTDINDSELRMAKVTGYDSKNSGSDLAQMLLLSPCLDYVNASQQLLTFRVMGKNMLATQTDNLQVLYIDPTTDETINLQASPLDNVYVEEIGGLDIPAAPDYNGEWRDYVIDLKGLDIADKFFIAFGYTTERGRETTAMYFIDDFSWGRDDIKFIRVGTPLVEMECVPGTDKVSEPVTIEGLNLTGPISISTIGADKSAFTVEPATLPAEGGAISVRFNSTDAREHSIYIELTAEGAPASYIGVSVNNTLTSAIDTVTSDSDSKLVDVYNFQGILLRSGITAEEAKATLPAGFYIIGGEKVLIK